jgi:hypothetical protein
LVWGTKRKEACAIVSKAHYVWSGTKQTYRVEHRPKTVSTFLIRIEIRGLTTSVLAAARGFGRRSLSRSQKNWLDCHGCIRRSAIRERDRREVSVYNSLSPPRNETRALLWCPKANRPKGAARRSHIWQPFGLARVASLAPVERRRGCNRSDLKAKGQGVPRRWRT